MFEKERKIPRSIKECYFKERTAEELWKWSVKLERWSKGILWYTSILYFLSVITEFIQLHQEMEYAFNEERVWSFFLFIIKEVCKYSLLEGIVYTVCKSLPLLLAGAARMVQDTKITAELALYRTAREEGITDERELKAAPSPYSAAGRSAARSTSPKSSAFWKCKSCETVNDENARFCKNCGAYK